MKLKIEKLLVGCGYLMSNMTS